MCRGRRRHARRARCPLARRRRAASRGRRARCTGRHCTCSRCSRCVGLLDAAAPTPRPGAGGRFGPRRRRDRDGRDRHDEDRHDRDRVRSLSAIEYRARVVRVSRRAHARAARRRPRGRTRRDPSRRRRIGVGQEHAAARGERSRAARDRRTVLRRCRLLRPQHPHAPAARARRRRRLRGPGSRGTVRRRPRGARRRLRAREPRVCPRPRCAGGSRRRSTRSASRTCATVRRRRCRAASASGPRSRVPSRRHPPRSCSTSRRRSSTRRAPTTCSRPSTRLNADLGTTVAARRAPPRARGRPSPTAPSAPGGRHRAAFPASAGHGPRRLPRRAERDPTRPRPRLGPAATHGARRPCARRRLRGRRATRRGPGGPTPDPATGELLVEAHDVAVALGGRTVLHDVARGAPRRGGRAARPQRRGKDDAAARARTARPSRPRVGSRTRAPSRTSRRTRTRCCSCRRSSARSPRRCGCSDATTTATSTAGSTRSALGHVAERHPRSLSGGERQRVAIAAVAVGGADVLLLDEPTRGMDAASRAALERAVARAHRGSGGAVVLATHDVELAARCATPGRRARRRRGRCRGPCARGARRLALRAAGAPGAPAVPDRRGGRRRTRSGAHRDRAPPPAGSCTCS